MEKSYSKILVAYDGSELSNKALKMAKDLAVKNREIKLDILNVIKTDVPLDLYRSAFFYQKIQEMKKRLKEEAGDFY
jgi:nucleotide-binding universal stress UspA family protein